MSNDMALPLVTLGDQLTSLSLEAESEPPVRLWA